MTRCSRGIDSPSGSDLLRAGLRQGSDVLTDTIRDLRHLRRPVLVTRTGLVAERATRAFWPVWTVLFLILAPLMMGWHETLPLELFWGLGLAAAVALLVTAWRGARAFRWPSEAEAVARVDAALPGRPIAALADSQAVGAGDVGSEAVWRAHLTRMEGRTRAARAVEPDLRVSARDPYGLRYVALLFFVAALLFGSLLRVGSVAQMAPGGGEQMVTGPVWEGWVEPPAYTSRPSLYLGDIPPGPLAVPEGSRVTLRLYGEVGALTVQETVSGRPVEEDGATAGPERQFTVARTGRIAIEGPGGAAWEVRALADAVPTVQLAGPLEVEASGEMSQPFRAADDHGVVAGAATIELDAAAVDRVHGLTAPPDPREPLVADLPMPFTGDRTQFEEALIEDFSRHPWANLPVTLTLTVEDAQGQTGAAPAHRMVLPGRRFFQPVAKAVIEQRRDLLWSKANAPRVTGLLRAIAHRPGDLFSSETSYLRLRFITRRLESFWRYDAFTDAEQEEIAQALWDLAIQLEEGTLADARERLRRAQERLAEAMRNGASDEEIAELMQELREAVNDYTRMLAEQAQPPEDGTDQPDTGENQQAFEFSQDELQALMDRIQELMEEGRMAEAQALMEQLNQLMENMRVTQGQQGQGQNSPGQQSMQDLSETLRDQQGLSDESFQELQDSFNQGQPGQQGRPGQQPGQQQGEGQGQGGNPQDGQQGGQGQGGEQSLAERQRALRQELQRQEGNLPNLGGEAAEGARRSLDRAGRAMDEAEEALRGGEMAEAIDRQAEAMDALREGIRNLGEALAENRQDQPGQGQQSGQAGAAESMQRDPLGRQLGQSGQFGTDENLLQGEDVYRRAEEILDELRRRSSERDRPEVELDYLRRLLERF